MLIHKVHKLYKRAHKLCETVRVHKLFMLVNKLYKYFHKLYKPVVNKLVLSLNP